MSYRKQLWGSDVPSFFVCSLHSAHCSQEPKPGLKECVVCGWYWQPHNFMKPRLRFDRRRGKWECRDRMNADFTFIASTPDRAYAMWEMARVRAHHGMLVFVDSADYVRQESHTLTSDS